MLLGAFSSVRASSLLIATCLLALSTRTSTFPRLTLTPSRNTSATPGMWATPTSTRVKALPSLSSPSTTRLAPCVRKTVMKLAKSTIATPGRSLLPITVSAWKPVRLSRVLAAYLRGNEFIKPAVDGLCKDLGLTRSSAAEHPWPRSRPQHRAHLHR